MSTADLIEYRIDRLEKSDEKKIELLEAVDKKVDKIVGERALEKQRERYILAILVFVGSFAMEYLKKYLGL